MMKVGTYVLENTSGIDQAELISIKLKLFSRSAYISVCILKLTVQQTARVIIAR
jgi:hypothetical protein